MVKRYMCFCKSLLLAATASAPPSPSGVVTGVRSYWSEEKNFLDYFAVFGAKPECDEF